MALKPTDPSVTHVTNLSGTEAIGLATGVGTDPKMTTPIDISNFTVGRMEFVEAIQDIIGGMVSGNTEIGISITYDDNTGKINATVTAEGLGDVTSAGVSVDGRISVFSGTTGKLISDSGIDSSNLSGLTSNIQTQLNNKQPINIILTNTTESFTTALKNKLDGLSQYTDVMAQAAAPAETATTIGALIHGAASKTTPVDADELATGDSAASNILKRVTWANIKATLKAYFDSLYAVTAKGVTNGDTHDHSGGDGAQIAYSGLSGLPTLGTAAAKNIPASGNASATEVVYGSDTRLADSRTPTSHATASHSDWPAAVSMTEVGYLDGVTSGIQAQINAIGVPTALKRTITQASPAFTVGQPVYVDSSGIYQLADASVDATADVEGIVSVATAGGTFTLTLPGGYLTELSGLTAGTVYYLSETAGQLTATAPTTVGAINKPVLKADSSMSGYVLGMRGMAVLGPYNGIYVDNYESVTAAISAATSANANIVFGVGGYTIPANCTITTGITGQGKNATFLNVPNDGIGFYTETSGLKIGGVTIQPIGTATTGQISFVVGSNTETGNAVHSPIFDDVAFLNHLIGVKLQYTKFVKFDHCRLHSLIAGSYNILIDNPNSDMGDISLSQCLLSGADKSIYVVSGSGLYLSNCKIFNGTTAAIEYNVTVKGSIQNESLLSLNGCSFENYSGMSGTLVKVRHNSTNPMYRIFISNSELHGWNSDVNIIDIDHAKYVFINDNEINSGGGTANFGIKLTSCTELHIDNNTIANVHTAVDIDVNCSGNVGINTFENVTHEVVNASSSVVQISNGSLANPSWLGSGSSITTKYLRGDGTWQTVAGGSSNGAAGAVQLSDGAAGFTSGNLGFDSANNRLRIGLGDSSTSNSYDIEAQSNGSTGMGLSSYNTNLSAAGRMVFKRGEGTYASFSALLAGSYIGVLQIKGAKDAGTNGDPTKFQTGRNFLVVRANENWSTTRSGFAISFMTHAAGIDATTSTEKVRITGGGNVGIGLALTGDHFTADPSVSLEVGGAVKAAGVIESTSTGFKFPDTTIQASAALPSSSTPVEERNFGLYSSIGTHAEYSRRDHSHGSPPLSGTPVSVTVGPIQFKSTSSALGSSDTIVIDSANNRVGIGTNAPAGPLHAYGSGGSIISRNNASGGTSLYSSILVLRSENSTEDMVDGFGSRILFQGQDSSGTANALGTIGAVRSGADNTGDVVISPSVAGTITERFKVTSNGEIKINGADSVGDSGITPDGGFYTVYTAAENLSKGQIVYFAVSGTANNVTKSPANNSRPSGIVYEDATSGNPVKVIWGGRADVLFADAPTMGYVVITSSTAGSATSTDAPDGATTHWQEIGHVASGTAISTNHYWVHLHFN